MTNRINIGLQAVLGLAFVVMGLNKFLGFMPFPDMPIAAGKFMGALGATGYMIPLIGITELLAGAFLLLRVFSALGLVLLAPVSLNIVLFHIFLAPSAGIMGYVLAAINLYLLFVYVSRYRPILRIK